MSATTFVIVLVVGILALQVAIVVPTVIWWRRRSRAVAAWLTAELEGETVVLGPEKGAYRGATAPGYPVVKNNGMIALTRRRLIFRTLTNRTIEVPVPQITAVRQQSVFKGSVTGGRPHLIVTTAGGDIGFYVFAGIGPWLAALTPTTHL